MESKIQKAIKKRQQKRKKIYNLSFPDFTFLPSPLNGKKVERSLINIIKYPYFYPHSKGDPDARKALTAYLKRQSPDFNLEDIIITSTINLSYAFLFKALSTQQVEILIPKPRNPFLNEVSDFTKVKFKEYTFNADYSIDFNKLEKKIGAKTKAILLQIPFHPGGHVISNQEVKQLDKLSKKHQLTLIIDLSCAQFDFHKLNLYSIIEEFNPKTPIITIDSLDSNFFLPGLHLSWLTFQGTAKKKQQIMEAVEFWNDTFGGANQLSAAILGEILQSSRKFIPRALRQIKKNHDYLVKKLSKHPNIEFCDSKAGLYRLLRFKNLQKDSETIAAELIEQHGLYFHPGYYYESDNSADLILTFLQEPRILVKAVKRLLQYLKKV